MEAGRVPCLAKHSIKMISESRLFGSIRPGLLRREWWRSISFCRPRELQRAGQMLKRLQEKNKSSAPGGGRGGGVGVGGGGGGGGGGGVCGGLTHGGHQLNWAHTSVMGQKQ